MNEIVKSNNCRLIAGNKLTQSAKKENNTLYSYCYLFGHSFTLIMAFNYMNILRNYIIAAYNKEQYLSQRLSIYSQNFQNTKIISC